MSDVKIQMEQRLEQLQDAMAEESIRGQILILTAQIDELLLEMLKRMLKPQRGKDEDELFRPMAPLGSFSSRTAVAFRLGLISSDDAEAFDVLRKVRNDCGHAVAPFSLVAEPHLGRVRRFIELTCRDFHRAIGLGGLVCPKSDEEWVVMACMSHIVCLEVILSKITKVPDGFWVGAKPVDRTVLPKDPQRTAGRPVC